MQIEPRGQSPITASIPHPPTNSFGTPALWHFLPRSRSCCQQNKPTFRSPFPLPSSRPLAAQPSQPWPSLTSINALKKQHSYPSRPCLPINASPVVLDALNAFTLPRHLVRCPAVSGDVSVVLAVVKLRICPLTCILSFLDVSPATPWSSPSRPSQPRTAYTLK